MPTGSCSGSSAVVSVVVDGGGTGRRSAVVSRGDGTGAVVAGEPVQHVRHVWDDEEATFMRPGTAGIEIHPLLTPLPGEDLLDKNYPNAFRETDLERSLRERGIDELVVVGMMTSMCVDATVRAAADLGFGVQVIADACAAPDLEFGGRTVAGADVHAAFLAALDDSYADVTTSAEFS